MLKITALFGNHLFPSVLLGLLTSATIVTGVGSVAKMAKNVDEFKMQVPEVKALSDLRQEQPENIEEESSGNEQHGDTSVNAPLNGSSNTNTLLASNENVQTGTSLTADTRCIITLWGKKYDVTTLQTTHSGGNVFNCGTDMTATYQSQHGTNLSRMAPYLISENTAQTPKNNSMSPGSVQSAQDTRCLVTLWGNQYDVTTLRNSHPGGNIFVCGTDMTSAYQSQHGTNLSMMQKYLVNGGSGGTSGGSTSTGSSNPSYFDDEQEYEDEYEDDEEEHESKELEEAWEAAKKQAEYERELAKKQAELEHEDDHEEEDDD